MALCNEPLVELANSGASGSLFYVTNDDEFIVKTVQHKEAEFLQKRLPGYYLVSWPWTHWIMNSYQTVFPRGPGFWKFNNSLLSDTTFVELLTFKIPMFAKTMNKSTTKGCSSGKWLKWKLVPLLKLFSKKKAKRKRWRINSFVGNDEVADQTPDITQWFS